MKAKVTWQEGEFRNRIEYTVVYTPERGRITNIHEIPADFLRSGYPNRNRSARAKVLKVELIES